MIDNIKKENQKLIKKTNNELWEILFQQKNIPQNAEKGLFTKITTEDIKILGINFKGHVDGGKMVYYDNPKKLPYIFRKYKLSLFPIKQNVYLVGDIQAFEEIMYDKKNVNYIYWNDDIDIVDYRNISSESATLAVAKASGILEDFIGETIECDQYNDKNLRTGKFSIQVQGKQSNKLIDISIDNAMYEIDCILQTKNKINAIETKVDNKKSNIGFGFLIKQLFFAYRRLHEKTLSRQVNNILVVYHQDHFHLYMYRFNDINNFNSLFLVKQKTYKVIEKPISKEEVLSLLRKNKFRLMNPNSFPQANDFNILLTILNLLKDKPLTKEELVSILQLSKRTIGYYLTACNYLQLISVDKSKKLYIYNLKEDVKKLFFKTNREKHLLLIDLITRNSVFFRVLEHFFTFNYLLDIKDIKEIIKNDEEIKINDTSTLDYKSSCVRGWVKWIIDVCTNPSSK